MGSNSGIERNWLVSVNGLNIYYSPESKTIKPMSMVLLGLAGGAFATYRWSQTKYYIGDDNGEVASELLLQDRSRLPYREG